ncbi:MAG: aryl-sulfate sulfotransferase, partial [Acidobacteriaceae bacterium]
LVGNPLQQTVVKVTNTGTIALTLSPALTGDPSYSIVAAQSCGTQLAPGASCNEVVTYAPTTPSAPASQTAVLNLNFGNAASGTGSTVNLTGISAAMTAGTVTSTSNPLVALYTITPPFAGNVTVNFGTTTAYGLQTWSVPTPNGGGPVSIEVAGMRANTAYHLQAMVSLQNGVTANDIDHTFTTGVPVISTPPVPFTPNLTVTTTPGTTPQPGIELINSLPSGLNTYGLYATDLSGNVIWIYPFPDANTAGFIQGFKQLPNGDFLINIGANSELPLEGGIPAGTLIAVREIDLIGNTVKQLTLAQLNSALATAGCTGCSNLTLLDFHHDVEVLPNGHWLVLANTFKNVVLNGQTTPTQVLGDVVIDVDTNMQPVWVWNEFDHLDVNRHPYMFPDWTHSNALLYSSDDGNIIVSIRHQNWLVKVNYANGTGNGSIVWELGEGGSFTLQGGTDPTDWFYAQHGPSFFTTGNSGIYSLGLMDNGDDRQFPAGVNCGTGNAPPCLYTTVPVMQLNESTKIAALTFHQIVPTNLYNSFGGDTNSLQNGNVEYDLCGETTGTNSDVFEVTQTSNPQTVWHMRSTGTQLFRTYRYSSLYPGVQW